MAEAEQAGARAGAGLQHALAGAGWDGSRQQDWLESAAVAGGKLPVFEPPAQQRAVRDLAQ
jgi:hypothetical protein